MCMCVWWGVTGAGGVIQASSHPRRLTSAQYQRVRFATKRGVVVSCFNALYIGAKLDDGTLWKPTTVFIFFRVTVVVYVTYRQVPGIVSSWAIRPPPHLPITGLPGLELID